MSNVEISAYIDAADGHVKLHAMGWVADPINPGWWIRTFGFPYKLVELGTITLTPPEMPRE